MLALVFLALGALVQYGSGVELETEGSAYVGQLLQMYGKAIGQWSLPLVAFVAFACMYGTVITVIDGYGRACAESLRLLRKQDDFSNRSLHVWVSAIAVSGIAHHPGHEQLSRIDAQVRHDQRVRDRAGLCMAEFQSRADPSERCRPRCATLSYAGLIYLAGFSVLFLLNLFGLVG